MTFLFFFIVVSKFVGGQNSWLSKSLATSRKIARIGSFTRVFSHMDLKWSLLGKPIFFKSTWPQLLRCKITCTLQIDSFGTGYGIGRKYLPIWVSVSVAYTTDRLSEPSYFDFIFSELMSKIFFKKKSWNSRLKTVAWIWLCKVYIFWEGHKILRNLHLWFVLCYASLIYSGDFEKLCGLLRIYEL